MCCTVTPVLPENTTQQPSPGLEPNQFNHGILLTQHSINKFPLQIYMNPNKFWPNPKTTADTKQVNLLLGSSSSLPAKNAENNSNVKVYLNKLNANKKQKKFL